MEEIWRPVREFVGLYEVSNWGRVRSVDRYVENQGGKYHVKEKILKLDISNCGYLRVSLTRDGVTKKYSVHRLVADAFVQNLDNKPCVNHKDKNKLNNRFDNLEWCTYEYNNNYQDHNELVSKAKSKNVYQYTLDGEFIREWASLTECQRNNGFQHQAISDCCLGKRKQYKGYKWSYTNDCSVLS